MADVKELAARSAAGIPLEGDLELEEFGARAAAFQDALLTEDRETSAHANSVRPTDERRKQAAQAIDWRAKVAGMSYEERVAETIECLGRRSTFRDILYGLLDYCQQERSYQEIEPYVEGFTEFHRNRQSPRRYVMLLLRTGALDEIELDEDGKVLTAQAKQAAVEGGLDPEDLDTLVYDWRIVTTDAGREALGEFSPQVRMGKLLDADPEHAKVYRDLISFCQTPQSMGHIADTFKGAQMLGMDEKNRLPRQAGGYVDRLERAGALQWDGSFWQASAFGMEFVSQQSDHLCA